MKSKVASSFISRARSARKIAEPFNTPTRITGWPAKSRVISTPSSATRFEIWSREISTLSSLMAFHIKLNPQLMLGCVFLAKQQRSGLIYEPQGRSTYLAGSRDFSHCHPGRPYRYYRSLDHE